LGLLTGDEALIPKIKQILAGRFGRIDYESPVLDFSYTGYYENEMGPGLKRLFLGFQRLRDLRNIYTVKLITNSVEKRLAVRGKRMVNIDPGFLDLSKVSLFSTKDYSHRVYLDKGIFAEVTLFYKDGRYNAWPWTYPDYRSDGYADIFQTLRNIYRNQFAG
jgi:hypothetical protein